eukprot:TRINITY_DN6646_c0_g1_i1.p1 TRINITY_DN6646_c0_g1~~TRINITY_DN6646_c0_g1_i1.p1  ORF type:complete len:991 (+),score=328.97 TRINITY_DN6646_c0_g1_i1:76-3048(+)
MKGPIPFDDPEDTSPFRQFGMFVLSNVLQSIDFSEREEVIISALEQVNESLLGLKAGQLFDEWRRCSKPNQTPVKLEASNCSASSERDDNSKAGVAVSSGAMSWRSELCGASTKSEHWEYKFPTPVTISEIVVQFGKINNQLRQPVKFSISLSESGQEKDLVKVFELGSGDKSHSMYINSDIPTRLMRFNLNDFQSKSGDNDYFAIQDVKVFEKSHEEFPAITSTGIIGSIEEFVLKALNDQKIGSVIRESGLGCAVLHNLAITTSSVRLLTMSSELIMELSPREWTNTKKYLLNGVSELKPFAEELKESKLVAAPIQTKKYIFDSESKSDNCEISKEGDSVKSTDGSRGGAILSTTFSKGVVSWEFELTKDKRNDECGCIGFATTPVSSFCYSSSSEMYLIRCYNGDVHAKGNIVGNCEKIHQGSIIKFTMDFNAETCSVCVDGTDKGPLFTGITSPISPCAAFYGSDRKITLLNVTDSSSVAASRTTTRLVEVDIPSTTDIEIDSEENIMTLNIQTEECVSVEIPIPELQRKFSGELEIESDDVAPVTIEMFVDGKEAQTFEIKSKEAIPFSIPFSNSPSLLKINGTFQHGAMEQIDIALKNAFFEKELPWYCQKCGRSNEPAQEKCRECSYGKNDDEPKAEGPLGYISSLMTKARMMNDIYIGSPPRPDEEKKLSVAFVSELSPRFISTIAKAMENVLNKYDESDDEEEKEQLTIIATSLLSSIHNTIYNFAASNIRPKDLGFRLLENEEGPATFQPILGILRRVRVGKYSTQVKLAGAGANQCDLSVLYPTDDLMLDYVKTVLSKGACIQFSVPNLPVMTEKSSKGAEKKMVADYRYERLLLLLQVEAAKHNWDSCMLGKLDSAINIFLNIPDNEAAQFIIRGLSKCVKDAGFPEFSFPKGCSTPKISLKIQSSEGSPDFAANSADAVHIDSSAFVSVFPNCSRHEGIVSDFEKYSKTQSFSTTGYERVQKPISEPASPTSGSSQQ